MSARTIPGMILEPTPLRAETEPLPTLDDLRNGKILQRASVKWVNGRHDLALEAEGGGRSSTSICLKPANRASWKCDFCYLEHRRRQGDILADFVEKVFFTPPSKILAATGAIAEKRAGPLPPIASIKRENPLARMEAPQTSAVRNFAFRGDRWHPQIFDFFNKIGANRPSGAP